MKQASIRQLQHHLGEVMCWVNHGEEVQITRRRKPVARLIPELFQPRDIVWPDFVTRAKKVFKKLKGEPLSEILREDRNSRW